MSVDKVALLCCRGGHPPPKKKKKHVQAQWRSGCSDRSSASSNACWLEQKPMLRAVEPVEESLWQQRHTRARCHSSIQPARPCKTSPCRTSPKNQQSPPGPSSFSSGGSPTSHWKETSCWNELLGLPAIAMHLVIGMAWEIAIHANRTKQQNYCPEKLHWKRGKKNKHASVEKPVFEMSVTCTGSFDCSQISQQKRLEAWDLGLPQLCISFFNLPLNVLLSLLRVHGSQIFDHGSMEHRWEWCQSLADCSVQTFRLLNGLLHHFGICRFQVLHTALHASWPVTNHFAVDGQLVRVGAQPEWIFFSNILTIIYSTIMLHRVSQQPWWEWFCICLCLKCIIISKQFWAPQEMAGNVNESLFFAVDVAGMESPNVLFSCEAALCWHLLSGEMSLPQRLKSACWPAFHVQLQSRLTYSPCWPPCRILEPSCGWSQQPQDFRTKTSMFTTKKKRSFDLDSFWLQTESSLANQHTTSRKNVILFQCNLATKGLSGALNQEQTNV